MVSKDSTNASAFMAEAVKSVISNLDNDQIKANVEKLIEYKNELNMASIAKNAAEEEVSLWDKINIFSVSDKEKVVDENEQIISGLEKIVSAKEKQIRKMISQGIPPSLKTGCLIAELRTDIFTIKTTLNKAGSAIGNLFDKFKREEFKLKRKRPKESKLKKGPIVKNTDKIAHTIDTKSLKNIRSEINKGNSACKNADRTLLKLVSHLRSTSGDIMSDITSKRLIDQTFNAIVHDSN